MIDDALPTIVAKRLLAINHDRAHYFMRWDDDTKIPSEIFWHSFACLCVTCRWFYDPIDNSACPEHDWVTGERIEWV